MRGVDRLLKKQQWKLQWPVTRLARTVRLPNPPITVWATEQSWKLMALWNYFNLKINQWIAPNPALCPLVLCVFLCFVPQPFWLKTVWSSAEGHSSWMKRVSFKATLLSIVVNEHESLIHELSKLMFSADPIHPPPLIYTVSLTLPFSSRML